ARRPISRVGCSDPGAPRASRSFWLALHYPSRFALSAHYGTIGDNTLGDESPQRDHEPSRQCDDAYAPHASATFTESLPIPFAQFAMRLKAEPSPCQLDRDRAYASIASFTDALLARAVSALVRRRR